MANYTFKKHNAISIQNRLNGKVVRSYVRGYITHDKDFICAGHEGHPRISVALHIYKNDKGVWFVIDPETGLSIGTGRTRKAALTDYENRGKAGYERIYMTEKHTDAAERFHALDKVSGFKEAEQTEAVPTAKLVAETSICYWYDGEVEGAKLAKKGKHAGMWWVRKVA